MSFEGGEALRERLTVCSLILPVLNLPALLVGLGVDVVGVIVHPVRFVLA
jgi:hypothetical protein